MKAGFCNKKPRKPLNFNGLRDSILAGAEGFELQNICSLRASK
jgi:hypothetical protein